MDKRSNIQRIGIFLVSIMMLSLMQLIVTPIAIAQIGNIDNVNTITFHASSHNGTLQEEDVIAQLEAAGVGDDDKFSATLDESVKAIGVRAFYHRTGLINAIIPGSRMTVISGEAFMQCTNLVSVVIGNGVSGIGHNAFLACRSLTSVVIPGSVTGIDMDAFSACSSLSKVFFDGDAPLANANPFRDITPGASVNVYRSAKGFPSAGEFWNELIVKYREEVKTPDGLPPVDNGDGSALYVSGAIITTPGGTTLEVPPETVTTTDMEIILPPGRGCTITYASGYKFNVSAGVMIILDGDLPSGYSIALDNPFIDVKASNWFFDNVMFVYAHGLLTGSGTGSMTFSPNIPLTRGMAVTVLWRLEGSPNERIPAAAGGGQFNDVAEDDYYYQAVNWAAANGIVSGYGGGKFGPTDNVTREQLATIFLNYYKYIGEGPVGARMVKIDFEDLAVISEWALDAVAYCSIRGVITGRPGNVFDPKGNATRAEFATMLMRLVGVREAD